MMNNSANTHCRTDFTAYLKKQSQHQSVESVESAETEAMRLQTALRLALIEVHELRQAREQLIVRVSWMVVVSLLGVVLTVGWWPAAVGLALFAWLLSVVWQEVSYVN